MLGIENRAGLIVLHAAGSDIFAARSSGPEMRNWRRKRGRQLGSNSVPRLRSLKKRCVD
jgi:hypothetical protein